MQIVALYGGEAFALVKVIHVASHNDWMVISNGVTKLVNVKNQDAVTKILDMVPDVINKFTKKESEEDKKKEKEHVRDTLDAYDEGKE